MSKSTCHTSMRIWIQISSIHTQPCKIAHACKLNIPSARWEVEIREYLEACRPASLAYDTANKKPCSNKVEGKDQHLRVSSNLHVFNDIRTLALTHTKIKRNSSSLKQLSI